jgi:hypothetical protein
MLVYFLTIWNILWPFGIIHIHLVQFDGHLLYFSQFGMFGPRKIWQPWVKRVCSNEWEQKLTNYNYGRANGRKPRFFSQ